MRQFAILIVLSFITIFTNSCKIESNKENKAQSDTKSEKVEISEDFDSFYSKFYIDSTFQFSRMKFPLKGGEVGGEDYVPSDIPGSTYEPRKEWKLEDFHAILPGIKDYPQDDYSSNLTKTDSLVTEKIELKESGYYEVREYRLIDNKWYLDYFFIQDL